jgi:hypothetical protein
MRTTTNIIFAIAVLLIVGHLSTVSYAASGDSIKIPSGSNVTVKGTTAIISGGNVTGSYSCTCDDTGTGAGCVVLQESNYIRCTKYVGDTTCKKGCTLSTFHARAPTSGAITITPATPGASAGPSTGSGTAPATR